MHQTDIKGPINQDSKEHSITKYPKENTIPENLKDNPIARP